MELADIEIRKVERCGSTNAVLLAEGKPGVLLVADEQTAGRGRRGRRWYSMPGADVTFSISAEIARPEPGLALVAGVAAATALRALGVTQAALKWPNDVLVNGAKLGGILVETRGRLVVFGFGINGRHDASLERRLKRPIAALDQFIAVDRDRVTARVAACLLEALATLRARGLEPIVREWEQLDVHTGQRVRVRLADGRVLSGLARGLERDGSLRVETAEGVRAVYSGRILMGKKAA
ncbi:MAG: biotin--[acetyl-CoA-carboxylase] ligase [Betaproteobacteria bacterium]|nr:biotin--[acetyl-CoA-carboxylase] ligase [Betaproteobacteria bacterium]